MAKKAMMEVIDRLVESGMSESDACLLTAKLLQEHDAEKKHEDLLVKGAKEYFKEKE